MSLHHLNTGQNVHTPFRWTWTDETAKLAQTVDVEDVGKVGLQVDLGYIYWLVDITPTWQQIGGGDTHTVEDAATNTITDAVTIGHTTTGTATTGFGVGIGATAETNAGTESDTRVHLDKEGIETFVNQLMPDVSIIHGIGGKFFQAQWEEIRNPNQYNATFQVDKMYFNPHGDFIKGYKNIQNAIREGAKK